MVRRAFVNESSINQSRHHSNQFPPFRYSDMKFMILEKSTNKIKCETQNRSIHPRCNFDKQKIIFDPARPTTTAKQEKHRACTDS
jgi:hypothetical protein